MADYGTYQYPFTDFLNRSARGLQDFTLNALQKLPEPIKKPIRQAVGRVATNIMEPVGYGIEPDRFSEVLAPSNLPHTISSIVKDQPAYGHSLNSDLNQIRGPLFRSYFDLPTRDTGNVFIQNGKDFRINPNTQNRQALGVLNQFKQGYNAPAPYYNAISGGYYPGHPDPFNFDLQPDEQPAKGKPIPLNDFARSAVEAIGKPANLQTGGYYNPPPKENLSYFPAVNDIYR